MNRVIVTGGNGFIGKHLVRKLLSYKPRSLILISNKPNNDNQFEYRKLREDVPVAFHTADIRDKELISHIFTDEKPDTCIHLAAKISVADSIKNPQETMDVNDRGTLNVLEACHNSKVNNFVFASSAAVYGDVSQLPIREDHRLEPLSTYGTSKMLAERHVLAYNSSRKIKNIAILRIFNVYGEGQVSEADVITKFAKRLSNGLPPVIYGNGKQTRDFISVNDVVEAILLSIRAMEERVNSKWTFSPVFNIGTGIPTTLNELAQKMIGIFGIDVQPVYEDGKESGGIMYSYADITKAKEFLHFVPKQGIETGLREIIGPTLLKK